MNVIPVSFRRRHKPSPIFIFLNLQLEYISEGRAFALNDYAKCLENCKAILDYARKNCLAVAHFRRIDNSVYFNQATSFSDWIHGFKPTIHEMTFTYSGGSIYDCKEFKVLLDHISDPTLIVCGFSGVGSCLLSAIDAHKSGHTLNYVYDASASQSLGNYNEAQTHEFASQLAGSFADLVSFKEIISQTFERKESIL